MIELLPDDVVDQIAAGEVVERPASVVKELVENALDAGAAHITVEIEGGGRELIRVIDDGCGMTAAEAELALRRHATSKLRRIDDLMGLATFGFRGEALPSIASVSRMTLTTRAKGALAAARLEIEGGRIVSRSEVGAPVGTRLEIRDLLFNVPARRKFLKAEATESAHIADVMSKVALANPTVHVRLLNRARTTLSAPAHLDGFERARAVLGRVGQKLSQGQGEIAGVQVLAYLAPPDAAQSTSRGVQLFVGRRPVRDRGLVQAVVQGYGERLAKGRYPVAVIFVDVPDPEVDVNVHPQKLEVRFADAQAVFAAVRHTVRQAVAQAGWAAAGQGAAPGWQAPGASAMAHDLERSRARSLFAWERPKLAEARFPVAPPRVEEALPAAPAPRADARVARDLFARAGLALPARARAGRDGDGEAARLEGWRGDGADAAGLDGWRGDGADAAGLDGWRGDGAGPGLGAGRADGAWCANGAPAPAGDLPATRAGAGLERDAGVEHLPAAARDIEPGFFAALRYLGQLDCSYLVCEADGELVLLDQHVADARAIFARRRRGESPPACEQLLLPEPLPLSAEALAAAGRERELLGSLGFQLELGAETAGLLAAPAGLARPAEVAAELCAALAGAGEESAAARRDLALAVVATCSACRLGDTLDPAQVRAILAELDDAPPMPGAAPLMCRLGVAELARRLI